jgi:hypothetical protein
MTKIRECAVCLCFFKFADEKDKPKNGFCRKDPPSATAQAVSGYAFPRMNEHEWCCGFSDVEEAGYTIFRGEHDDRDSR